MGNNVFLVLIRLCGSLIIAIGLERVEEVVADTGESKHHCVRKSLLFRLFHSFQAIENELLACTGEGTSFSVPDSL